MTGGIARLGTTIRRARSAGPTVLLYTGRLVAGLNRQDVLKAETLARALGAWNVTAENLSEADARLGQGELLTLSRFTHQRIITSSIRPSTSNELPATCEDSGLMIGGVAIGADKLAADLEEEPVALDEAVKQILQRSKVRHESPILMLDADRDTAVSVARRYPKLRLVTYRSTGRPPMRIETVGPVVLATPGEGGQYLVTLSLDSSGRLAYNPPISLTPAIPDDPATAGVYRDYLRQVTSERLWDSFPRQPGPAFVGSAKCAPCHREAYDVWVRSAHHGAYETLQHQGHALDPDCVPCHVVGGAFRTGFRSTAATPELASVGCESCHGSSSLHAGNPRQFRLPGKGRSMCQSCHESLNSPNFDFSLYWPRIRHGM
jgi:hypothetical protein